MIPETSRSSWLHLWESCLASTLDGKPSRWVFEEQRKGEWALTTNPHPPLSKAFMHSWGSHPQNPTPPSTAVLRTEGSSTHTHLGNTLKPQQLSKAIGIVLKGGLIIPPKPSVATATEVCSFSAEANVYIGILGFFFSYSLHKSKGCTENGWFQCFPSSRLAISRDCISTESLIFKYPGV